MPQARSVRPCRSRCAHGWWRVRGEEVHGELVGGEGGGVGRRRAEQAGREACQKAPPPATPARHAALVMLDAAARRGRCSRCACSRAPQRRALARHRASPQGGERPVDVLGTVPAVAVERGGGVWGGLDAVLHHVQGVAARPAPRPLTCQPHVSASRVSLTCQPHVSPASHAPTSTRPARHQPVSLLPVAHARQAPAQH